MWKPNDDIALHMQALGTEHAKAEHGSPKKNHRNGVVANTTE